MRSGYFRIWACAFATCARGRTAAFMCSRMLRTARYCAWIPFDEAGYRAREFVFGKVLYDRRSRDIVRGSGDQIEHSRKAMAIE